VTVDRRTTDRLKTFHLTSGRDVETLIKQKKWKFVLSVKKT
jgi:hypothetical protein